jgi:hypothetical protein
MAEYGLKKIAQKAERIIAGKKNIDNNIFNEVKVTKHTQYSEIKAYNLINNIIIKKRYYAYFPIISLLI